MKINQNYLNIDSLILNKVKLFFAYTEDGENTRLC